jgi:hypothetical protein
MSGGMRPRDVYELVARAIRASRRDGSRVAFTVHGLDEETNEYVTLDLGGAARRLGGAEPIHLG